jgi:hypothetical protein
MPHSCVMARIEVAPILTYSFSGELVCKHYLAIIVSERLGVLLSA